MVMEYNTDTVSAKQAIAGEHSSIKSKGAQYQVKGGDTRAI